MKTKKRLLSILLSFVMVLGLVPGMSLTAYANEWEGNPYADLVDTTKVITFDNKAWYLIEDNSTAANAGTVTLLAKECVGASSFNSDIDVGNTYSISDVKTFVDNWYNNNISAAAKAAVSGSGMFLLTKDQARAITNAEVRMCPKASGSNGNFWWLCSQGLSDGTAASAPL